MEFSNFTQEDVTETPDKPTALRVTLDATAKFAIIPSIYIGLFATLGALNGGVVGGDAKVYGVASVALDATPHVRFQAAVGVDEPMPPLEPSYCASTKFGCSATCSQAHDFELDVNITLSVTGGYKMYATASFGSWNFGTIGSDTLVPVVGTSWRRQLGSWCYYLFQAWPARPGPAPVVGKWNMAMTGVGPTHWGLTIEQFIAFVTACQEEPLWDMIKTGSRKPGHIGYNPFKKVSV